MTVSTWMVSPSPESIAAGKLAFSLPGFVIGSKIIQQAHEKFPVMIHKITVISGGGEPAAEAMKVRLRLIVVATQPKARVVVEVTLVAQPAAFGKVMTGGATDGVVCAGVFDGRQEFGNDEASRRLLDMFPERPPTEIIKLLHFDVGTFKTWDVLFEPARRLCVGNMVGDGFRLHRVEAGDMARDGIRVEHGEVGSGQSRDDEEEES